MKKRIIGILSILAVIISTLSIAPAATAAGGFTDLKVGAFYYDAVDWAVEQGITSGTSAEKFSPKSTCTRGQVVSFLWRAAGSPAVSGSNPFTDVSSDKYYYNAVLWAVEQGITSGVSADRFNPSGSCTRAQVVSFLWRAAGSPAVSASNPFADVSSDKYYYNAVLWAVGNSITSGVSAGSFAPASVCTRAQVVSFLHRFYNPLFANIQATVYKKDSEQKMRTIGNPINLGALGKGEYFTFDISLKNQSAQSVRVDTSYALINGERVAGWASFSLDPGGGTYFHVYCSTVEHFQAVGSYTVELYINEQKLTQKTFAVINQPPATNEVLWSNLFPMPTDSQIAAYKNPNHQRSQYIAGWWDLGQTNRFTEYSVDFKADYLPIGTYCCLANFYLDLSPLEQNYSNVRLEQISGYAGFQRTDKEYKPIMSMWDIHATEKSSGENVVLRPRVVYSNNGHSSEFTGEGEGAQCYPRYEWERGHWYRLHLKCTTDAKTGNTLITFYVCDLETMEWTTLCTYDTLIPNTCFRSMAVFLENYLPQYGGEVRSLEVMNGKIRAEQTGEWIALDTLRMHATESFEGIGVLDGSFAYGATPDRFWMITSGVGGNWYDNGLGQRDGSYTLK